MIIVNGSGMFYSGSREPGLEWVRGRRLARWYNELPKRIRWWEGGVRRTATLCEGNEYRSNGRLEAHVEEGS